MFMMCVLNTKNWNWGTKKNKFFRLFSMLFVGVVASYYYYLFGFIKFFFSSVSASTEFLASEELSAIGIGLVIFPLGLKDFIIGMDGKSGIIYLILNKIKHMLKLKYANILRDVVNRC